MSDLSSIERLKFEAFFDMESGYVLDFSNNTFSAFTIENVGIDIFDSKYEYGSSSKANRLRKFWMDESNEVVGKLLSALLDYWLTKKKIGGEELSSKEKTLYDECQKIVNRLNQNSFRQIPKNTSSPSQKGRIFISYRRADTSYAAGRIYDRLVAKFSEDAIFMDVDTIEGGVDFVKVLEDAVRSCDVLIALIGRQWLSIKDKDGKRRLDNPEDFVRIEVATALKRNIRVIPVLVDGVEMPRSTDLPENLKALARRNALQVNHHSFNPDVYRLLEHAESALGEAEISRVMKAQAVQVAREKAERETAEKAAREKAERGVAEKAAREKQEQEAAEKTRLEAEELARQKAAIEKAEREAAEKAAREKAEKDAIEKARLEAEEQAKIKAEEEERQRITKKKTERETVEKIAREREIEQKTWFDKTWADAEERAVQKAAKEKAEREAVERAERERKEKELREKQAREAREKAKRESEKKEEKPATVKPKARSQFPYWFGGFIMLVLGITFLSSLNNSPSTPQLTPENTQTQASATLEQDTVDPSATTTTMLTPRFPTQENSIRKYINLYIDQIKFFGNNWEVGDLQEVRLIILAADTTGKSSGLYCPVTTIKVRKGDIVAAPCLIGPSFDEAMVSDGVYWAFMVLDETKSPLPANLSYVDVTESLSSAFGDAVTTGVVKVETIGESAPYTFSVNVLMDLVTGQARTWLEKAEFVGVQGIYLSRQDHWSLNKTTTINSTDRGIQITYTIVGTTSAP